MSWCTFSATFAFAVNKQSFTELIFTKLLQAAKNNNVEEFQEEKNRACISMKYELTPSEICDGFYGLVLEI
jgi:hypothetical protein